MAGYKSEHDRNPSQLLLFFFNFVVTGKFGRAFELVSRIIFVPNNWKVNKKLRPQTRKNTLRPQSYYCVRLMKNETTCIFLILVRILNLLILLGALA